MSTLIKSFLWLNFHNILLDSITSQNAFHDGLFVSLYSILQMELYFPSLVKNHQISALGCLESVANKKRRVPSKKKQLVK